MKSEVGIFNYVKNQTVDEWLADYNKPKANEESKMAEYDNTNRGAIWTNQKKATEKHPDFTGSLNVEGKEYWVSAWRGDEVNPKAPKLSFSVNAKEDGPKIKTKPLFDDSMEDDIPF